ncbi:MAG: ATP-binding protein [Gammaproteobacteria bacterium]|nr:ATP-binding protein [Gammaproteobacteria bacterium]
MIDREIAKSLRRAVTQYPVLTLTGPRQSGKTTLLRHLFPEYSYVSLERPDERAFALDDPVGFLDRFSGPVIFDEAQQTPELFSYIQVRVDEDPAPGRFVLSGSQNFLLLSGVSQSLAGRARLAHLMPLSLRELNDNASYSWTECAVQGGYPRIHDRGLDPGEWLAQYFQTYLQRDVRQITQIGDLEQFSRFVMLCAGRAGQLLNHASLANDCGVAQDTVRRWLSVLEASFVVFRLLPHHRRFNRRLTRSPKLYFVDSGLLCWLLGIGSASQLNTHAMRGLVFENLMISEALKAAYHAGQVPRLHFWRDHRGNEVDLIVDDAATPHPVEMKSAATMNSEFFKGLRFWQSLAGEGQAGTLVYGGDESYVRGGIAVTGWRDWPARIASMGLNGLG